MNCTHCGADLGDDLTRCSACLRQQPAAATSYADAQTAQQSSQIEVPTITPSPAQVARPAEPLTNTNLPSPRQPVLASSLIRLIAVAVLTSVLVAAVWFFIGLKFELIVLFPAVAALIVGAVIDASVKKNVVRNVGVAVTVGVLAALLTYALRIGFDIAAIQYVAISGIDREAAKIAAENPDIPLATIKTFMADHLTFARAAQAYVHMMNTEGISISRYGTSASPITGTGVWILDGLQAAFMAWIVGSAAAKAAATPYCESCAAWKRSVNTMRAAPAQTPSVLQHVQAQDWSAIQAMPRTPTVDGKNVCLVGVNYCPKCDSGDVVVTKTVGGKTKPVFRSPVPVETVGHLRSIQGAM